jgi:hypothetical protein
VWVFTQRCDRTSVCNESADQNPVVMIITHAVVLHRTTQLPWLATLRGTAAWRARAGLARRATRWRLSRIGLVRPPARERERERWAHTGGGNALAFKQPT